MVGSGVLVGRLVLQELLGQAGGDVDGLGRLAGHEPSADRDNLATGEQLVIAVKLALVSDTATAQPGNLEGER